MAYRIEEKNGKFEVLEIGFEDIKCEVCDSEDEAQRAVRRWEARDNLQDEITDFYDRIIDNYSTILSKEEIKEMVKER